MLILNRKLHTGTAHKLVTSSYLSDIATTQPKSTCSKSTTETLEKGVKYVQS